MNRTRHMQAFNTHTSPLFSKIRVVNEEKYAMKPRFFDGNGSNIEFKEIKIKNIANFKQEPLKKYDLLSSPDDILLDSIRNGNPSPSRFTNPLPPSQGRIVSGLSKWQSDDGSVQWRACSIHAYDEISEKYRIEWNNDPGKWKDVNRLNLIIESENLGDFEMRIQQAGERRRQKLYTESVNGKSDRWSIPRPDPPPPPAEEIVNGEDFSDILIAKKVFYGILNKSLSPFSESSKLQYKDSLTQLIISEYQYGVRQFILCIRTVGSLDEFFLKYIPHLRLSV